MQICWLIKAAKLVDERIIEVKALEHWQKLKIYEMFLVQYLDKKKIKLFTKICKIVLYKYCMSKLVYKA